MAEEKPQQEQKPQQPKIIIDSDWKAQAQAEKERLAAQQATAKSAAPQQPAGGREAAAAGEEPTRLPPATFTTLVSTIASQALFSMGAMPDPQSQRRFVNLDVARFHVETLKVLEEKTAGRLTDEEKALLDRTLYELRTAYVQLAQRMSTL